MTSEFDPDAKVIGQVLMIFPHNMRADQMKTLLEKYNIAEIDPERWYSVYDIISLFSDITTGNEAMFNLVSVGMEVAKQAILPPNFENLTADEFFHAIDDVFQAQHQGNVGSITSYKSDDTRFVFETVTPYPDDFWYGVYYGWARRYLPPGTHFIARYDETTIRRDKGGNVTNVVLEW